jgi:hypothetical protein
VDAQNAQEEAWLPAGDFESSPGAGEAPGAEQWVVTTYGVVRYAAARLVIEARPPAAVSVAVSDGAAFVWPAQDANLSGPPAPESEGWERIAGGRFAFVPKAHSEPRQAAASATARCSQLAREAGDLAAALLNGAAPGTRNDAPAPSSRQNAAGPDSGPSLAADQVRVRRLARAACAVAQLRAGSLTDADSHDLLPVLRQADSDWRALPDGPKAPGDAGPPTE